MFAHSEKKNLSGIHDGRQAGAEIVCISKSSEYLRRLWKLQQKHFLEFKLEMEAQKV